MAGEDIRLQSVGDDTNDVVRVTCKTDSLLTEACGTDFCWDCPSELTDGQLENERPDESQNSLCHAEALLICANAEPMLVNKNT